MNDREERLAAMIRGFSTTISADPVFRRRSSMAQLLYYQLYTHPGNHLCGLFMFGVDHMAVDLKTTPENADEALKELVQYGFAEIEPDLDLVWIPAMAGLLGDVSAPKHPIGMAIAKYLRGLCLRECTLIARVATTLGLSLDHTVTEKVVEGDLSVSGSGSGVVSDSGKHPPKSPKGDQGCLVPEIGPDDSKKKQEAAAGSRPSREVAHRMALILLGELSEARVRVNGRAEPLRPVESNLREIRSRIMEGNSADDIRHVIRVCEARAKISAEAAQYFDAVSPFRQRNFGMWRAKTLADAAKYAPPGRVGGGRMPQPEEWGGDDVLSRATRIPQKGDDR